MDKTAEDRADKALHHCEEKLGITPKPGAGLRLRAEEVLRRYKEQQLREAPSRTAYDLADYMRFRSDMEGEDWRPSPKLFQSMLYHNGPAWLEKAFGIVLDEDGEILDDEHNLPALIAWQER